jgi:cytochrome c5
MKQSLKRLVVVTASGLILLALVLLIDSFGLAGGLVRLIEDQRTSAQSKRGSFSSSSLDRELLRAIENQRSRAQSKRNSSFVVDLFRTNCARCHGADGRGDTPLGHTYQAPDFTDSEWWRKHSDTTRSRSLVSIVARGKGGMPAFGKELKPSEIKLLVNYVRRFRKSI